MYNGTLMLADEDGNTEEDEEKTSLFEKIQASFPLLMAWLYKRRSFSYEDMTADEVQKFVGEVSEYYNHAVDTAIRQVPMAQVSVQRLKESNYVFSGIKVFHELNEAFPALVDENNEIRPFKDFLNDVQKINNTYNGSYLRTEYNFAYQSSLMASRWKQFEEDGDRYNLQYRTAYDDRVRTSHRKLEGITLPPSSKFWNDYFPPNGWNCRCTVVQVRKDKYPESNEQEAMNLGSQATAGKHQEMFKFNPGKAMTTFPAYNAYTISKCKNCKMNGALKLVADIPDNELCGACRVARKSAVNMAEKYSFGKGSISISDFVNREDSDYQKLIQIAEAFAKDGSNVRLTPKMSRPQKFRYECIYGSLIGTKYEGKCPDLEIDGKWFEHEGYITNNPKNALRNMFNDGLVQSNRLIIDKPNLTDAFIKRSIARRIKEGQDIEEVWLKEDDRIRLLYKKSEE